MKKQDKLFDLLKRNGWQRSKSPEGVCYRFKTCSLDKTHATFDGFEALGWLEALEITYKNLWLQKEGEFYATYIEF